MKFYCDNCNTKYGIADEKVRGKVLKVRCKKCKSVITVREQRVPAETAAPAAPAQADLDLHDVPWHYSLNGQSHGPFRFAVLAGRFASGELGDECYVWTDSFADWKPVRQVDVFSEALDKGQRIKPRHKTVGAVDALKAVSPEQLEQRKKQKQLEQRKRQEQLEQREQQEQLERRKKQEQLERRKKQQLEKQQAEASAAAARTSAEPESDASPRPEESDAGQEDRLSKLRDRLKSESQAGKMPTAADDEARSEEEAPDVALADGGSLQAPSEREGAALGEPAEDAALGPTLPMEQPEDDQAQDDEDGHEGLFSSFDGPVGGAADARGEAPEAQDGPENSDHIPFFGDAPELKGDSTKVKDGQSDANDGITGSLLIQLDKIQKQGRGKKALLVAVALLVVGGLVGTGIYISSQYQPEEPTTQAKANPAQDDDDELVIRTYGSDEQNKMLVLGNQHVGEGEGDGEGETSGEDDGAAKKDKPKKLARKSGSSSSDKRLRGAKDNDDDDSALKNAFKSARKKGADKDSFRRGLDDGGVAKSNFDSPLVADDSSLRAAAAVDSNRDDPIYKPTDALKQRNKSSGGATKLTRKQISQGIKTVRRSVGLCRERHTRRGQPLDARKIYLTLTVEPTGRISAFKLAPDRVRHSEFESCLRSHRGRWKFPSFSGDAQKMRAPFVLN